MPSDITVIFFDADDVLRVLTKDEIFVRHAESKLMNLLQTRESHEMLFQRLKKRWSTYCEQAESSLLEASEIELWTQNLLPEYEPNMICANAPRFSRIWRERDGRRDARPDAIHIIKTLYDRGYTLGIISNTIAETEIPDWIISEGLTQYFKTIILSTAVRLRKPDPAIYHLACRCIGESESHCAYVGKRKDLIGASAAGLGMTVQFDDSKTSDFTPDHTITNLSDLMNIFPSNT